MGDGRLSHVPAFGRHELAIVDAKAEASSVDAHAQATVLHEIMDADDRGGKARSGADAKRPARSEPVGHPTDDRRANRRAAQGYRETDRHHAPAHDRLGG
jgi:hypothetical protein